MTTQDKIDILKELIDTCGFSIHEGYPYQDTEIKAKQWLAELEEEIKLEDWYKPDNNG